MSPLARCFVRTFIVFNSRKSYLPVGMYVDVSVIKSGIGVVGPAVLGGTAVNIQHMAKS